MLETYNGVSVSLPSFQYGSRTATHHNPDPYCLANFSVIDNTRSLARRSLVILNLLYCPRSNTVDHYVTELVLQVKDQTSYYISPHISLIEWKLMIDSFHIYTQKKKWSKHYGKIVQMSSSRPDCSPVYSTCRSPLPKWWRLRQDCDEDLRRHHHTSPSLHLRSLEEINVIGVDSSE